MCDGYFCGRYKKLLYKYYVCMVLYIICVFKIFYMCIYFWFINYKRLVFIEFFNNFIIFFNNWIDNIILIIVWDMYKFSYFYIKLWKF